MSNIFNGMTINEVMDSITDRVIKIGGTQADPTYLWAESGFTVKINGAVKNLTAVEMLKALAAAGFIRSQARGIFIINEETGKLITKNAMGGKIEREKIIFSSPPKQTSRQRAAGSYSELNAKKPTGQSGAKKPAGTASTPTAAIVVTPKAPEPLPEGATTLDKVPDDGCEMPVGENAAGKPMYCAKPGRPRMLKRGAQRLLCDLHRAKFD